MSALLCNQTMELQEEKVNTTADWLADEATSWLLGSDWERPSRGTSRFWEGVRGFFQFSSHVRDHKVFVHVCVYVLCVEGHWDQLPIKRMGQRKQRQETGSWKRKLHPLSLRNTVPIATTIRVGSQERDQGSNLASSPFKMAL